MQQEIINFDNNATTKIAPEVIQAMQETYEFAYNASANHTLGRKAAMMIEEARFNLSEELNAQNYDIYFTSGGTEGNNMVLFGDDYEEIITSKIEHNSIYNSVTGNCRKNCKITEIAINKDGSINLEDLRQKCKNAKGKNFLVSIMRVVSESGVIQPIKEAAQIVHQNFGLIHSDLVQTCGKIDLDFEELNIDFGTISAHKFNGPLGVGAVFVRRGIEISPLIYGGGQESGKRSGTLNLSGIVGLGKAITLVKERVEKFKKLQEIRDFLENEIAKIAGENVIFFGKNNERIANTSFFAIKNADAQTQLIHFDLNKIMVSAGSACSSGSTKPSRILQAMQVEKEFLNPIRLSLGLDANMQKAQKFIEIFTQYYNKIKD